MGQLNKEICRHCVCECNSAWASEFDDWWDVKKKFLCIRLQDVVEVEKAVPEKCLYFLEHRMETQ